MISHNVAVIRSFNELEWSKSFRIPGFEAHDQLQSSNSELSIPGPGSDLSRRIKAMVTLKYVSITPACLTIDYCTICGIF